MSKEEIRTQWEQRISEYRASGLSATQWCTRQDLPLSTLRYWITRLNKDKAQNTETQWISLDGLLTPEEPQNSMDITIQIGKAIIRLGRSFSDEALHRVMKILQAYA